MYIYLKIKYVYKYRYHGTSFINRPTKKKNQNRTNNVKNSQIIGFSLAQVNNIHK